MGTAPANLHHDTPVEEWASALVHGLGALLALAALVMMLLVASLYGEFLHLLCLSIFGAAMVSVYLASTLLHLTRSRLAAKAVLTHEGMDSAASPGTMLRRLERALLECDHIAIYLLIAGTYTPVTLLALGGAWGWSLFITIWSLVTVGLALRLGLRLRHPWLAVNLYLVTGWIGLVAAAPLVQSLSALTLMLILAGGMAYTTGVVFFFWQRLPFNHAIWHGFVLVGTGCHFLAVWHEVVSTASV